MSEALPVNERPICQWCGKPLAPHYDTEKESTDKIKWRRATSEEMRNPSEPYDSWGDPTNESHRCIHRGVWLQEHDYLLPEYRKGCWRVPYKPERIVQRRFLGAYGFRNLFCAQPCALAWAVANAKAIKRGEAIGGVNPMYVSGEYNQRVAEREKKCEQQS